MKIARIALMKMNSKELLRSTIAALTIDESHAEKEAIVRWLFAHEFGLTPSAIMSGKEISYEPESLNKIIARLNDHEPLQYILGETSFYGRVFKVNPSVLIPRPETELLVSEVVDHFKNSEEAYPSMVDIGTGSGCIATTLALEIPAAIVFATDISEGALDLAAANARNLKAKVRFIRHDILKDPISFGPLDAVVSNPPYVPEQERSTLRKNVIDFEPHLALFSGGDDALFFYDAIAKNARKCLKPGGLLITEINESYGPETAALYKSLHYSEVDIIKDLSGKDRIVRAIR
ncbi:MAG TPA: peptide chain release factor N(5)-glutamine methyltransferase [Cyclobacteriaceae bacterium]|nr:peptide chain release factor N(5)-glutamine methyltransferase [Cyclobacteriaceae bacterium]